MSNSRAIYPHSCMAIRLLLFALSIASLSAGVRTDAQHTVNNRRELKRAVDHLVEDKAFENAFWGIVVRDLSSGEILYERNGRKSFIPASNTKLYTTAAALDRLGPDFAYTTSVWTDGGIANGRLQGNLIIRGSGDPTIGGRFFEDDWTAVFRAWADSLRLKGVTSIGGDLVGDDDLFDDLHLGFGWNWDDETFGYSAEIGALVFNEGCVPFEISGSAPGTPARIRQPIRTPYVTFENRTVSVHGDSSRSASFSKKRASNHFILAGRYPEGKTDSDCLATSDPTGYFLAVLHQTLIASGIAVLGDRVDVDDLSIRPDYKAEGYRKLFDHRSPPLLEIVRQTNKDSNNLPAEQLLKTLGAVKDSTGIGCAESGIRAATHTFARAAVDTSRLQLVDGSGLSRRNLITPEMTVDLLSYMYHHPDASVSQAYITSLPIAGIDGTLERRFSNNGLAKATARAKTGHVGNVSTLSGYVSSAAGTPLAFSIMCNSFTVRTRETDAVQDVIVNLLAAYRR